MRLVDITQTHPPRSNTNIFMASKYFSKSIMFSRRLLFLHRKVLSEEDLYHDWCVSTPATLAMTRACTGVWARWSTATAATARPGGRRSSRRSSSGPGTTRPDTGEVSRKFHEQYYIFENYRESLLTSLTPGGTGSTAAATPATSTGTAATAATGRATGTPTPRPPRTRLSCTPTQRTRREFRRVDTSVL